MNDQPKPDSLPPLDECVQTILADALSGKDQEWLANRTRARIQVLLNLGKTKPSTETDSLREIAEQLIGDRLWNTDDLVLDALERAMRLAIEATRAQRHGNDCVCYCGPDTSDKIAARMVELLKAETEK